jgi:hypothetical protein
VRWSPGCVDVPAVVVDDSVVVSAEQDQVGQLGGAAVGPEPDVVGVAPAGWAAAAGEGAAAVADDQGAAHWSASPSVLGRVARCSAVVVTVRVTGSLPCSGRSSPQLTRCPSSSRKPSARRAAWMAAILWRAHLRGGGSAQWCGVRADQRASLGFAALAATLALEVLGALLVFLPEPVVVPDPAQP